MKTITWRLPIRDICLSGLVYSVFALGFAGVVQAQNVFHVDPSGDLSGVTDHTNVTTAFSDAVAAGPGSVVELGPGDFYFHKMLQAENCACEIRGHGKDSTFLHTVPDFGLGEGLLEWQPAFLMIYPVADEWDESMPFEVTVSDMTFLIEHGNTGWGSHDVNNMFHSMDVIDTVGLVYDRADPRYDDHDTILDSTELRVTYRSLRAIGTSGPEFAPFNQSILNVFSVFDLGVSVPEVIDDMVVFSFRWGRPVTGEFVFEDLEYANVAFGCSVYLASDADIRFGGPGQKGIVARDGNAMAIELVDVSNSHVEVSNLEAHGMAGVYIEQGFFGINGDDFGETYPELLPELSTFDFHHNTIHLAEDGFWAGFELWNRLRLYSDGPNTILANITQNTFHFNDSEGFYRDYTGIFSCGVDDTLVNGNTFVGRSSEAMNPEILSLYGLCGGHGWSIVGNNFNNFATTSAPLILWPGTSNFSVVGGNIKHNVLDFGTDNSLAGVNNKGSVMPPDTLGRGISADMKRKGRFH
jgi:hypothetical protein